LSDQPHAAPAEAEAVEHVHLAMLVYQPMNERADAERGAIVRRMR
jgi:hypothetical protein